MQRAREEIDASRLSLAALNDLVYDNAHVLHDDRGALYRRALGRTPRSST
jgi:hypothetical protein